ncbi:DUF3108 domain-containing protein [Aliamphritea spongicola]|uniref:DUF3108 domain-containing protein n=1 Tax=Aliamphritea spongicola TaxID=707589 RepID=UPI00196A8854|nr:DUF3108 domain-containing protein [Aliamphritea spongicola]MBN3560674.1 DUF3108 domain-containing protein [Aliamphritea spongicola]
MPLSIRHTFQKTARQTAALCLLLLPVSAAQSAGVQVEPYKAVYASEWDLGFSLNGEAVRQLQRLDNGWQLSLDASAMVASLSESSKLRFSPEGVEPRSYSYQRKVLGKKTREALSFDWQNHQANSQITDDPWQLDVPTGALDKLSYQLQLRLDLINGREALEYKVADDGKLKTYRFVREGEEDITTELGTFKAVKLRRDRGTNSKRQTWIWFAPELNYQLVKLLQSEKDGKQYSLVLKELK